MKTIAFFNNKGGVGKTSLAYHLSCMFAELGHSVVVADLDPQSNLSSMFMDDDELSDLWSDGHTIFTAMSPIIKGIGDLALPVHKEQEDNIFLIPGDIRLSGFEDELSHQWALCLDSNERAFRIETAFARIIQDTAKKCDAELTLIDIGPNLGAINRAALLACDYIITPLSPDFFSWQGLKNMKPALTDWRKGWKERKKKFKELPGTDIELPNGGMALLGYIAMRFNIHASKPVKSYQRWIDRMPSAFAELTDNSAPGDVNNDKYCLDILKDYHSLMPMAQEARKPMFRLTSADGVFGANMAAIGKCREDFKYLAEKIIARVKEEN